MKSDIICHKCGVCCTVLSISSLDKKAGIACKFLSADGRCLDYENRPAVCRSYKADELCVLISTLDRDKQMAVFKAVYGE